MKKSTEEFMKEMTFYSDYYWYLAGCADCLDCNGDIDIVGDDISPDSGDQIVIDERGCGDTYGLCHDCADIYEVKVIKRDDEEEESETDLYDIEDIKNINFNVFNAYKSQDFFALLSSYKNLINTDVDDDLSDLSDLLIESAGALSEDCCFDESVFEYGPEYQHMLEEYDADFSDDLPVLIASLLAVYILNYFKEKIELEESLKIILNGQIYFSDNESTYLPNLEYLKVLILLKLFKKDEAYTIVRSVQCDAYEDDLFEELYDDDQYTEWLGNQMLIGPDNYNHYRPDQPDPIILIDRFRRIGSLFCAIRDNISVDNYDWNELTKTDSCYEKEKMFFKDDFNLALYWLLYFSMTSNEKYKDVKSVMEKYNHKEKMKFINIVINFFDNTSDFTIDKINK